ncbi:TadE/TadG family type IV pilus assembly protein [Actinomadura harenae]|uniref:TadE/TadG family type IV pilus assembly protein n=1 Tax=Actinomadura harenae TaxID=2483351 RepID=UPI0036077CC1
MEWAMLTPILILIILLVVQFAMVFFARQVALAAAQAGARTARTEPGGDWNGLAVERATANVDQVGKNLLNPVTVQAGQEGDERWVEVRGTAVRVIPFMTFHVAQRSRGPIECFRPDVGSGTACQGGTG